MNSENRREVAERLREAIIDDGHLEMPGGKQGFQMTLQRLIGTSNPTRPALYARLADLIDPTSHAIGKGHPDKFHVCYGCSVCGFGWYESVNDEPYRYCPHCGARLERE